MKGEKIDNKQVLVNKYSPVVTETMPANPATGLLLDAQNQRPQANTVEFKETPLT